MIKILRSKELSKIKKQQSFSIARKNKTMKENYTTNFTNRRKSFEEDKVHTKYISNRAYTFNCCASNFRKHINMSDSNEHEDESKNNIRTKINDILSSKSLSKSETNHKASEEIKSDDEKKIKYITLIYEGNQA